MHWNDARFDGCELTCQDFVVAAENAKDRRGKPRRERRVNEALTTSQRPSKPGAAAPDWSSRQGGRSNAIEIVVRFSVYEAYSVRRHLARKAQRNRKPFGRQRRGDVFTHNFGFTVSYQQLPAASGHAVLLRKGRRNHDRTPRPASG